VLLLGTSCQIVRENEQMEGLSEEFSGLIHPGEGGLVRCVRDIDINEVTELFLNLSEDEVWEYQDAIMSVMTSEDIPLFKTDKYDLQISEGQYTTSVSFGISYEQAQISYSALVLSELFGCFTEDSRRERFPEEELENCTKEEALAFCRPYADLLGYDESLAEVYAVTLDIIKDIEENLQERGIYVSAPVPGYIEKRLTKEEVRQAKETGGNTAVYALMSQNGETQRIPWEKKDECFVVMYRQMCDGILIDDASFDMAIVYAPQYEYPVILQGGFAVEKIEDMELKAVLTSEDAVGKVLTYKGVESLEEMHIEDVEPVYRTVHIQEESYEDVVCLAPYWGVTYHMENERKTLTADAEVIYIDAVYGEVWN